MTKQPNISELFQQRRDIRKQLEILKQQDEDITDQLKAIIPNNGIKDGVYHHVSVSETVSWQQFALALIDKFVPKSKQAAAMMIKSEFAKPKETHTIKEEK